MDPKRLKIISGGQTGVDRAALDAALALWAECGGWCPAGRFDEDGTIPERYPVKELKEGGYKQRTIQNIADADGTLIFYFGELEGGTEETVYRCIKLRRPYKLIDGSEVSVPRAVTIAREWIWKREIRTLNVAGPRASKYPEGYQYAFEVVTELIGRAEG
ncbi:MAG TPA: putative molybdenum carrier protein [Chthoniobacteraceae bacterium]|jgi:hypothetical protein|nr:putative molybdenum carrier protein [Chthoniobacteraceae bacterium]